MPNTAGAGGRHPGSVTPLWTGQRKAAQLWMTAWICRPWMLQYGRGGLLVGHLELRPGQFLGVDCLERHSPDLLHEPGRPVHVPDPGILHDDLEVHLSVLGAVHVQLHLV